MIRRFINRILAALSVASAAMTLAPMAVISQQVSPSPVTTVPATEAISGGGGLEKVTVTGYLIPRVGGGPQPVFPIDQDFITKQADQTLNEVLNRYPGGLSVQHQL